MKKVCLLALMLFSHVYALELGLSYDDVLLVPMFSNVSSRSQVNLSTRLTKNITINMPIISSNMDTVTESEMAIAIGQQGGIGIIHRFNTIEQQVKEVEKVKRYQNGIIEKPLTISVDATIGQARELTYEHNSTGFLVTDANKKLLGILSARDMKFRDDETRISEVMTSRDKLIYGQPDISIDSAKEILMEHRIEKLPLLNSDETIAGLITCKDILRRLDFPNASTDYKQRLLVGAAIGVQSDALERATALVNAGADVLVIDIAHGHSQSVINLIKELKKTLPTVDIIAGNVATEQATKDLIEAGADAIKVGIGPGSICTTRITTGCGYPQLSAIMQCYKVAQEYDVPVIADGGIKFAGDITKAIAAGASTVMLGNLLSGTDESPGMPFIKNGKKYKIIRGMASTGAKLARDSRIKEKNKISNYVPEGVEAIIPYRGSVHEIAFQLLGGLRSGMSYCGVHKLSDLVGKCNFVKITSSGMRESHPHDVQEIN